MSRAEISLINFSCYYIFSTAFLISSSDKCRVFFTGIGFTHILQDCSGYFFNSGICFGIIQAKPRLIFIDPLNKPVIRFSPALVRCPNLLINFLASSTLLHTIFSFPNCRISFFMLTDLTVLSRAEFVNIFYLLTLHLHYFIILFIYFLFRFLTCSDVSSTSDSSLKGSIFSTTLCRCPTNITKPSDLLII